MVQGRTAQVELLAVVWCLPYFSSHLPNAPREAGAVAPSLHALVCTPGLWGAGLLFVLFLLGGFRLFGVLLPLPFGLVLLAFLVAHGITPFWCSSWHVAVSASSGPL